MNFIKPTLAFDACSQR